MSEPKYSTLDIIYNVVFFPRKLIDELPEPSEYEGEFIYLILESLKRLKEIQPEGEKYFRKLYEIFKIWNEIQGSGILDGITLNKYLKQMSPENPILLYIREQNSSIVINCSDDGIKPSSIFSKQSN